MKKLLFAAFAALAILSAASCEKKNDYIGLQMYSVRKYLDPMPEALQKIADAGYSFVEPAGYDNGKFYGIEPAEFKAMAKKAGLDVLCSHTGGPNPCVNDHQTCVDWWAQAIDAHAAAGCVAIVAPGMGGEAYASAEGLQQYCDLYNEVGEMCAAKGLKFGYHNHYAEFTVKFDMPDSTQISVYDYMLKNTDPEKVFFEIDLYWATVGGVNPVDVMEANPGRFYFWHVKDELEVGASGKIDFPEIYRHASVAGMKYQVVEQEAYSEGADPFESVKASCDYTKTMRPE